jgi:cyclohexanecarboxylate-CoA ligase
MLGFAETKLLIAPKLFRGFDHETMAPALQPKLSKLQHIIVVDGEGANSFDQALLYRPDRRASPDQMAVLMFTSGTTGSPRGVMHCFNTLLACNIALAGRFGLDSNDSMLVCSPLAHMTGSRRARRCTAELTKRIATGESNEDVNDMCRADRATVPAGYL